MLTLLRLETDFPEINGEAGGVSLPSGVTSICRLATGRSALLHLINRLPPGFAKMVLMPCYVPEGVIRPFAFAGIQIRFYRLDQELQPLESDVAELSQTSEGPIVFILIHYFGYPSASQGLLDLLRKNGALLVSDCAHAPISQTLDDVPLGEIGDIALYSLNKFIPVCDGAIMLSNTHRINVAINEASLPELPFAAQRAYAQHLKACRTLFETPLPAFGADQLSAISSKYDEYYTHINEDLSLHRQSLESRRIELCFPFVEAAATRRHHGARIMQAVSENSCFQPLWPRLPSQVVPFAIPVVMRGQNRDQVQEKLLQHGVVASTLVDKWNYLPRHCEAHFANEYNFLNNHLLLPSSEFMSDEDVTQLIDAVQSIQ